jgi:sugar phosphate isomerase/epimerase
MPQGADLIRAVGHPAAGLVVDFWHVFRAGTTLTDLGACLDPGMAFGVELCDAQLESIGTLFEDTRDRRTLVGQGTQDVVGFIRTMREAGFPGPWGVEILSVEHRQRPLLEALTVARDTTLDAFQQADRGSESEQLSGSVPPLALRRSGRDQG